MTKQIVVHVEESKVHQFLKEIEKLEYAHVEEGDWWDDLLQSEKEKVLKSIDLLDAGHSVPDEHVRMKVRALFNK